MENYINILRCILNDFNIRKNDEFDNIIKYIINKIFDEYYNNRDKSKYCINNLIRKYNIRYFDLLGKYGTIKTKKVIYRFNKYSKRNYIEKLLRNHEYFYIDENEDLNRIIDNILEVKPDNYKKYVEHLYLDKFLDRIEHTVDEANVEVDLIDNQEEDDFEIISNRRVCFYPPCLNQIIGSDNYCSLHNKDMI